jgi:hypothetical protein
MAAAPHLIAPQRTPRGVKPQRRPKGQRGPHEPFLATSKAYAPTLVWEGVEYPRMEPGRYLVRGLKVQGPEWVRAFSRWSIRIEFATVHEPGGVSAFFNLGSDRLKQYIGRQSKYFQAWTLANGGLPRKGEQMSPEKRIRGGVLPPCEKDCRGARRKRERSLCVLALSRFCLADERPPSVRNSAERRKIRRIGRPCFYRKPETS